MIEGIDVSHWQGAIDWAKVSSTGTRFAFAKASEGVSFRDTRFMENAAGIVAGGMVLGAYHFFRPLRDARDQAANFLRMIEGVLPRFIALDVEVGGTETPYQLMAGIEMWLDEVSSSRPGSRLFIYTSAAFWKAQGLDRFPASEALWVAHYTSQPQPKIPASFTDYVLWQYSDRGSVAGIEGHVDLNRYHGTAEEFQRLAGLPL